ncbi:MAG: hypothetical protein LBJ82_01360 [Deltaproteobacteria bacterium]|nr:hypothetical protein [Deltaproteobacteria bacterium]
MPGAVGALGGVSGCAAFGGVGARLDGAGAETAGEVLAAGGAVPGAVGASGGVSGCAAFGGVGAGDLVSAAGAAGAEAGAAAFGAAIAFFGGGAAFPAAGRGWPLPWRLVLAISSGVWYLGVS